MIPGVLYTLAQLVTSNYYRELAKNLTNWENHRTERQYQQNLLIKLLVFEFINNFLVLYFLAFIYNDINMLRSTVVTTMTISQVRVSGFFFAKFLNSFPPDVKWSLSFSKVMCLLSCTSVEQRTKSKALNQWVIRWTTSPFAMSMSVGSLSKFGENARFR